MSFGYVFTLTFFYQALGSNVTISTKCRMCPYGVFLLSSDAAGGGGGVERAAAGGHGGRVGAEGQTRGVGVLRGGRLRRHGEQTHRDAARVEPGQLASDWPPWNPDSTPTGPPWNPVS